VAGRERPVEALNGKTAESLEISSIERFGGAKRFQPAGAGLSSAAHMPRQKAHVLLLDITSGKRTIQSKNLLPGVEISDERVKVNIADAVFRVRHQ
jgi:hypothetical protein